MSDAIERLGALVELDPDPERPEQLGFAIEQYAILTDGRRVVLDLGRGWVQSLHAAGWTGPPLDPWTFQTTTALLDAARDHLLPDDDEDPAPLPWDALARSLAEHGIAVGAEELQAVPHDILLSDAIHARLARTFAGWGADVAVEEDGDALRFNAEAYARLGDGRRLALDRRRFDVELSSGDRARGAWPLVGTAEDLRGEVRALWWRRGAPAAWFVGRLGEHGVEVAPTTLALAEFVVSFSAPLAARLAD